MEQDKQQGAEVSSAREAMIDGLVSAFERRKRASVCGPIKPDAAADGQPEWEYELRKWSSDCDIPYWMDDQVDEALLEIDRLRSQNEILRDIAILDADLAAKKHGISL